ncbi:hypothetical protein C3F00_042225, partial [Pseudomonas sp. MWU13-2860]
MDTAPTVSWLEKLVPQAWHDSLTLFVALTAACAALLYLLRPETRKSTLRSLLAAAVALVVINLGLQGDQIAEWLKQVAIIVLGLALIRLWAMMLMRLFLPLLRLHPPRILEDILLVLG